MCVCPKLDTPLGFQLPKKRELVPREAKFMPGAQTDLTPSSQEIRGFRVKAEGFGGVCTVVAVPEGMEQG